MKFFDMKFWDRTADLYDAFQAVNREVYKEMTATVERLVPRGAKVLDCAAGTGELSLAAAKKADSVLCTDLSEKMLANARRKAASRGIQNIGFEVRNLFHLEDEDGTYDVVIAGNVLHLLTDPQAAVRELYRVTKPGGKLLLPTFTPISKDSSLIKIYERIGCAPEHWYTPQEYKDILCETGYDVKAKLIRGAVPCTFAVIKKPL